MDATLRPVLASIVFYIIVAMTLYATLVKLGVPPTSLIAVFGAAGLAIGLALKDTLSNIASGLMLLALRPVAVGEFIDTGSAIGTVEEIGLFSTTMKNIEGVYIYIPNSQVWAGRLQNFGRHQIRKALIDIGVAYDSDLTKVQAGLLDVLSQTPDVLTDPTPPEVYVMTFADSSINLSCRCWLPADNWLARTSDLRMAIKQHLDDAGVEIPFPQRVIHMRKE
ncbi:mechanosensitive ion channel family protein [Litorimonas sp. RW-G-Af-16]|uniref:mechanosensitive ion channel family protein n=1 Tax=Litorimonas sp. RW-G-Af-16 TaxID=3241168 RepID=UPI003AAE21B4